MDLEQIVNQEIEAMTAHQRSLEQQIQQEISPIINEYAAKFDGSIEIRKAYCIKLIHTRRVPPQYEPYTHLCLLCGTRTNWVIRTHGWSFPCCQASYDRVLRQN